MESLLNVNDKRESKKDYVVDKLKELIKSESLSEGDKLPSERDLSKALGVSRNVLREAVIALCTCGLIEVRERQGIFIKGINEEIRMADSLKGLQMLPADFVLYQLEVRTIISVPAGRLAALRRTNEDLKKLHECYDSFLACPYKTPAEQLQNGKWEALLHHLVTEAAHNPILSRVNENINELVERNNYIVHPNLITERGWLPHIQQQHAEIIRAIEDQDQNTAGDVLLTHLTESVNYMREKFPNMISQVKNSFWELSALINKRC